MDLFTVNEQNNTPNTSTPVVLPAKRKRGRPRKDGSVVKKGEQSLQSPTTSVSDGMRSMQQNEAKPNDKGMVGRIVSGVIDGCFDAGYFLSVRIGNNGPPLRGVIFEPGRVTPVSSDNDVAPNAKLFERSELPIPAPNPQYQGNGISQQLDTEMDNVCSQVLASNKPHSSPSFMFDKQISSTGVPALNDSPDHSRSSLVEQIVMQQHPNFGYLNQTQSVPPAQNLRMVEQDEMMQVYEVSVQSEGLMEDAVSSKDWMSESSAKLNHHHVGLSPEQCSTFHIVKENLVAMEPKSVIQETTSCSQVKQNQLSCNDLKDSFRGLRQSCLIAEDQALPQESLVMDGFQTKEMGQKEPPQARIFELHDTPIVDQIPGVIAANQKFEPGLQQTDIIHTPTNGPNPEPHQTPTVEKVPSVPRNPENVNSELEPSRLDHYDLERQNFGILRDLVAGNHHFLPPEAISDQPGKFVMEKPNSPKNHTETVTHLEPKATVMGNNESSDIRKPGSDPTDNNELHPQTDQRTKEAMPFDLELAAEEFSCLARPEIKVSSPTKNPASHPESDP